MNLPVQPTRSERLRRIRAAVSDGPNPGLGWARVIDHSDILWLITEIDRLEELCEHFADVAFLGEDA